MPDPYALPASAAARADEHFDHLMRLYPLVDRRAIAAAVVRDIDAGRLDGGTYYFAEDEDQVAYCGCVAGLAAREALLREAARYGEQPPSDAAIYAAAATAIASLAHLLGLKNEYLAFEAVAMGGYTPDVATHGEYAAALRAQTRAIAQRWLDGNPA